MELRVGLALALLAACTPPAGPEPTAPPAQDGEPSHAAEPSETKAPSVPTPTPTPPSDSAPPAAKSSEQAPKLSVLTIPFQEWQIHALQMGDETAPCVLFLHGARYSAQDWNANGTLEFVARRGWRALAVDIPGFGGTGGKEMKNHFDFLPQLFETAGLDRPVVVAPSMGGLYLLTILHQHHDLLRGIVPIAPVGVQSLKRPIPVELPTLIVWGANDTTIPPAQADELMVSLPGARKEIIADAGHPCYLDQTQRFHALLGDFLDSVR